MVSVHAWGAWGRRFESAQPDIQNAAARLCRPAGGRRPAGLRDSASSESSHRSLGGRVAERGAHPVLCGLAERGRYRGPDRARCPDARMPARACRGSSVPAGVPRRPGPGSGREERARRARAAVGGSPAGADGKRADAGAGARPAVRCRRLSAGAGRRPLRSLSCPDPGSAARRGRGPLFRRAACREPARDLWDEKVDAVVTERRGLVECGPRRPGPAATAERPAVLP